MSQNIPINIDDILHCTGVESTRIEFKSSWSEQTAYQVLKTLCAFANDFQNLNGGYIVIGVEEDSGCALLPPKGLSADEIDTIQKWVRGHCNTIDPQYFPILEPVDAHGVTVLVMWAPASDSRPHQAPDGPKTDKKYWIRIGSETIDAHVNGCLTELLQMNAKVPFDDRRALDARIEDMREGKVREFLRDIRSGLIDEPSVRELYRKLKISVPVNAHDAPKNAGLLFFSEDADQWFSGARIEIVHFNDNESGDIIEEKVFTGGLHEHTRQALQYLEGFSSLFIEKQSSAQASGYVSYPSMALREALVNAVYHRAYNGSAEPVKVYLYPNRMEIISYPGPVPGISMEILNQKLPIPPVPARNRRIGEFLKELRLAEGRGTGIPKLFRAMSENGSPEPKFDFDEQRTYFRVTLEAHPEYVAVSAIRDVAHLKALGKENEAFKRLEESWRSRPNSPSLTAEYLRELGVQKKVAAAEEAYIKFKTVAESSYVPMITNILIEVLLNNDKADQAQRLLKELPALLASHDALEAAVNARRLHRETAANRFFEKAGELVLHDSRALLEYAQCKIALAKGQQSGRKTQNISQQVRNSLLNEAKSLLERVIRMNPDRIRMAWAWRELARIKNWLKYPTNEISLAYDKAVESSPEIIIVEERKQWLRKVTETT